MLVIASVLLQAGSQTRTPAVSSTRPPVKAMRSPLTTLAAFIQASEKPPPGNATLVISTQTNGSSPPQVGANLYTDSGAYYWAPAESGLPEAIADHENLANGVDAREVAAALYAENGDLATARIQMVNATPNPFGLGSAGTGAGQGRKNSAAIKAARRYHEIKAHSTPPTRADRQEEIDNYIWNNCVDALTEGAGNPQVRAGVLRLLSTVPEVTVSHSVTDGQPTLTLTAGRALFAGIVQQVLTINAKTGIPISSVSGIPGQKPSSVVTFRVSRVTVADIAAGDFMNH